ATFGWSGPGLFICGMIGAAHLAYFGSGERRALAIAVLCFGLVILCGGYVLIHLPSWRGPAMIYFEIRALPLYSAFAVSLCLTVLRRSQLLWIHNYYANSLDRSGALVLCVTLAGGIILAVGLVRHSSGERFVPSRTAIVSSLQQAVALRPGEPFRGYVATFTGAAMKPNGVSWIDLASYDWGILVPLLGNDHRFIGLWEFGIPTLQEYNQYTTPPSYLFLSRLLARPQDR